jgi:hypothetical protein
MKPRNPLSLEHTEQTLACPLIPPAGQQALGIQLSHNRPVSWWRVSLVLLDKVNQYLNHLLVVIYLLVSGHFERLSAYDSRLNQSWLVVCNQIS